MQNSKPVLLTDAEWAKLYKLVPLELHRRFRTTSADQIEEATQSAVVALFMAWTEYPSTIKVSDDRDRLFHYALRWATWRAKEFLVTEFSHYEHHTYPSDDEEEPVWEDVFVDPDPTPEEQMLLRERAEDLQKACDKLDVEDYEAWLVPLARGEGIREQARREGRHMQSVRERRERGTARLKKLLVA